MLYVSSYQIADSIDIKRFKTAFHAQLIYADSDELFYQTPAGGFVYVFKFGIVSFFNYDELQISSFMQLIEPFSKNPLKQKLSDDYLIETNAPEIKVGFNKIELPSIDAGAIRLIMLNISQSVALDHYSQITSVMLQETNYYTELLEHKGNLKLSGQKLKKLIGRTLNLKNRISEYLYIFDAPDETWENEVLSRLDNDLKKTFDLQVRFRTIQEGLGIVKENLDLFKEMLQHRNSTRLEWIIILLILVEVINLFIEKLF